MVVVALERVARQLGDRARQLDAGGAAADDDEGQLRALQRGVVLLLRALEGDEDPVADVERVAQALQPRCARSPLRVTEVERLHAGGHNQEVVRQLVAARQPHHLRVRIDRVGLGHQHLGVLVPAQERAKRIADVGGLELGRGRLIEQRLKDVVVLPVDERDLNRRVPQRAHGREPAEATAEDHDTR